MNYLRSFSLVSGREQWFYPLLGIGGVSIGLFLVGLIPIIGIIAGLANLVYAIHVQGWVATTQRRAMHDEPGLPAPFESDYIGHGLRSFVVQFVWALPLVAVVIFAIVPLLVVSDSLDRDVAPILTLAVTLMIVLFALAWSPLVQLAAVRTNLAGDWSGLNFSAVFQTLMKTLAECYLGMLV